MAETFSTFPLNGADSPVGELRDVDSNSAGTYIFRRSEQLSGAHANEIKHGYSHVVIALKEIFVDCDVEQRKTLIICSVCHDYILISSQMTPCLFYTFYCLI